MYRQISHHTYRCTGKFLKSSARCSRRQILNQIWSKYVQRGRAKSFSCVNGFKLCKKCLCLCSPSAMNTRERTVVSTCGLAVHCCSNAAPVRDHGLQRERVPRAHAARGPYMKCWAPVAIGAQRAQHRQKLAPTQWSQSQAPGRASA